MGERLPTPAGSGYQPEYDLSPAWAKGRSGEEKAEGIVEMLERGAVEVKADYRARDRVFVECFCKWSDGKWHRSGILDPNSKAESWMVMLSGGFAVCMAAAPLRKIAERIVATRVKAKGGWGLVEKPAGPGDEWPTVGVALPLATLAEWMRWAERPEPEPGPEHEPEYEGDDGGLPPIPEHRRHLYPAEAHESTDRAARAAPSESTAATERAGVK